MILVGEPHPELHSGVADPIRSISALHVRVLGFRPIEEFVGYLAACDIVLNLRYPTVGENSGTLMRALGLGKAVIVSEVGSFSELPETICLKAPVDASEEDHLFEYLNLLVSRPEVRRELWVRGRARGWSASAPGRRWRGDTRIFWSRWRIRRARSACHGRGRGARCPVDTSSPPRRAGPR